MRKEWLEFAMELLSLPTSPLHEGAVAGWLRKFAAARGMKVGTDRYGNLMIRYRHGAATRGRRLVIAAHMDHPGFAAVKMTGRNRLTAHWKGGVPPELFPGAKVRFFDEGRWVRGEVVSTTRKRVMGEPRTVHLKIDRPVATGSVGMWDFGEPRLKGNLLYARGHDDIAGVAAIASMLDEMRRRKIEGAFDAFFTRGEEGGFYGAIAACQSKSIAKNAVIVALEASRELPNARLGDGVVLRVGDKTSIFTPWVTDIIKSAAEKLAKRRKGFRFQRRLMDGGNCESTIYTAFGYDAGGLCLPLRNYHNVDWKRMKLAAECIDIRDYEAEVELLVELVRTHAADAKPVDKRGHWRAFFKEHFSHVS